MFGEYIVPNWVEKGATRERLAAFGRVAGLAVRGLGEIFTARQLIRVGESAGTPVGCPALYSESETVLRPRRRAVPDESRPAEHRQADHGDDADDHTNTLPIEMNSCGLRFTNTNVLVTLYLAPIYEQALATYNANGSDYPSLPVAASFVRAISVRGRGCTRACATDSAF